MLLVLSDSLAFYDRDGALPADDPRLWPNLVGAELGEQIHLVGRVGWTTRDAFWALTGDPAIWAVLPTVTGVVIAVVGMDSMPSPLPTALREQIRYLRPERLRRAVRGGYARVQPLLAPLGGPTALNPRQTVTYLEKIRSGIAALRPDLPILMFGAASSRSPGYGYSHRGRAVTDAAVADWAARHQIPVVPVADLSERAWDLGTGNIDGVHWDDTIHVAVAQRVVDALRAYPIGAEGTAQ